MIVVGAGRLGAHLAAKLSGVHRIAVIERDMADVDLERLRDLGVHVVLGDAQQVDVLERAGVGRARGLVAATGSDLTNFSVALLALERAKRPDFQARAHVGDLRLADRDLGGALSAARHRQLSLFSLFAEAGQALVAAPGWDHVPPDTLVVIAGFGRFGRAVLSALLSHPERAAIALLVTDRNATNLGREVPAGVPSLCADLADGQLQARIAAHHGPVRVLLCTDDDGANIVFALHLRGTLRASDAEVQVYTRMFEWPEALVGSDVTSLAGIHFLSVVHLAEGALDGKVRSWFDT